MSTGEAQVKFTEIGSQQVVTAFKNVGSAAGTASTNVGNAGNAIKNVGSGMKNTASQIGNMATAFATLALSVVNTWRAYRDLNDQQLALDKTNKKIHATELAIKNLKADILKDQQAQKKGGNEYNLVQAKINKAQQDYNKHQKDGKHTSVDLKLEYLQLQKMMREGVKGTGNLTAKEEKLKIMEEGLTNSKTQLKQQQKSYNDTVQDFYLSIAPLALSSIGSLTQAFSGVKGMLGGGAGGLIGSFGGLGLVLGGASLAILAYQNNWLGFKDIVGGVITWFQDRIGVWKETFGSIFDSIKKGNWGEAFGKIKAAALAFWEDLKKSVPFFGGIATLADQLRKGDWVGAFSTIRNAAVFFWTELKKAIPLFGTVETIIKQIGAGDWKGVFTTIGDAIKKGLEAIFGGDVAEKIVLKFQLMKDSAITELNLMKDSMTKAGGPIDLIQQGLAKLGKGDIVGGFTGIWTGFDKAVGILNARFNDWIKLNFGIDLASLESQAKSIGLTILNKIKEGLTFVARTWIDPIVTALLNPDTWSTAFLALGGAVVTIGQTVFNFIAGAIAGAASDPKGASTWWTDIGQAIWTAITDWFSTNLPDAKKAMEGIAQSFMDALTSTSVFFQNIGRTIWNDIIEGLKTVAPFGNQLGGAFDQLKVPLLVEPKVDPKIDPNLTINAWTKNLKPVTVTPKADTSVLSKKVNDQLNKFMRGHYPIPFDANMSAAEKKWQAFVKKVQMTKIQLNIAGTGANIKTGSQAGAYGGSGKKKKKAQGGMHETLSRDTIIEAHRGERVDIHKRSETQMGVIGGKGINVKVFIGNEEFKGYIHTTVNEDQGNSK